MRKRVTRNHSFEWARLLCPSKIGGLFLLLFTFITLPTYGNDFHEYDWNLSCDDLVQVSLNQAGEAEITPQMMLIGAFPNYDNFVVAITNAANASVSNPVTCEYIGETLTAKVIDTNTGNSCWGSVQVEDKLGPQINCPNSPIILTCDTNIDSYPPPNSTDNCDPNPIPYLINEIIDDSDICGNGAVITRTFVATDQYGNHSLPCDQVFQLSGGNGVDFPADTIWDCSDYNTFPNITNPSVLTGDISTTGSGIPSGVNGLYCPYNATNNDDTLSSCSGIKIIRTWVVLNWCQGTLVYGPDSEGDDNEQTIKVLDSTPPSIIQDPLKVQATISGNYGTQCASVGYVPPATVTDDCSNYTVRIFSPVGELNYQNGIDGAEGGYIPTPGLTIGTHLITYEATDDCGNFSELIVPVEVVDETPPGAVCDLITDVNLTTEGTAEVFAETFDDGSNDNCCMGYFLVKRMEQSDAFFAPTVIFNCDDDVETVVVRVFDCFDNYNECMVQVEVQDKELPICIAPAPASVSCLDLVVVLEDLEGNFGAAIAADNCSAETEELEYTNTGDGCGNGLITRMFRAFDESGNESACQQEITVTPHSEWDIHFPPDWYGECGDSITSEDIIVNNSGCDLWAVSFSDQYFGTTSDSVCTKIIREWSVRNWCTYESGDQPIVIPNQEIGDWIDQTDFNNYGYYTYQQIILLSDDTPPVIEIEGETLVCSFDDDCLSGIAVLDYSATDACTQDVDIEYVIDVNQDGTIDIVGTDEFEKNLPLGCHEALFSAEDGCGNKSELTVEICVIDCKNPTPYCEEGLIVEIMQFGFIELWANDFDAGSFDNCEGDLKVSFSQDTSHTSEVFTCWEDPIEQYFGIEIWVTDIHGNQAFCETELLIQDNFDICLLDDPLLEGLVQTAENQDVENVTVELSGNGNVMTTTDSEGHYEFVGLTQGNDYSIVPTKNDDPVNGVTTLDLVYITRHILNTEPLGTPYRMIAADANNSGSITTTDLVEIRKLILTMIPNYANNASWRFVDSAYEFPNPDNPWQEQFPEVLDFNNLSGSIADADFAAIKIGDVNASASTNSLISVDDRNNWETLYFQMEDRFYEAGDIVEIPIYSTDLQNVSGFQFTLNFETTHLELLEISENDLMKIENFNLSNIENGMLTGSWHTANELTEKSIVFTLKMAAKSAGRLSDNFRISSEATQAEAYRNIGGDFEMLNLDLQFGESQSTGLVLYQNQPNPFQESTTIGFDLPKSEQVIFSIFDTNGKMLKTIEAGYDSGYHQITIHKDEIQTNGILFYQLETATELISKRMVLMRE